MSIQVNLHFTENQGCVSSGKPSFYKPFLSEFVHAASALQCQCNHKKLIGRLIFLLRREGKEVQYDRLTETTNKVNKYQ